MIEIIPVVSQYFKKPLWVVKKYQKQNIEICMCHQNCKYFKPGQADNCKVAQAAYELSKKCGIVLVHSCSEYDLNTGDL